LAEAPDGNLAARFIGRVRFEGDVVVAGGLTANLPTSGGGQPVQSFAVQALSSVIQDFGQQALVGKQARVNLSQAFVAVADVANYHVFLSGIGGETPLVMAKDATGFNVAASDR